MRRTRWWCSPTTTRRRPGMLFDQTLQRRLHERAPQVLERFKTPLPQWWIGLAGPLCTMLAALSASPRLRARRPCDRAARHGARRRRVAQRRPCQGANDNLSGVAALVALAQLLATRADRRAARAARLLRRRGDAAGRHPRVRRAPSRRARARAHRVRQPRHGRLAAPGDARGRGAGLDGALCRPLAARPARGARGSGSASSLQRGFRARASTDSVIPSRAGYPIATLVSMTDWRSPANYHLPSDIPANLDYATVARRDAPRARASRASCAGARWPRLCDRERVPEGDTIHHAARRIRTVLEGRTPDQILTPHPRASARALARATRRPRRALGRRARQAPFLRFDGELTLHSHLRMTGSWGVHREGARWRRARHRAWLVLRAGEWSVVEFDGPVLELMRESRTRFDRRLAALGPDVIGEHFDASAFLQRLRAQPPERRDRRCAARPADRRRHRQRVEVRVVLRRAHQPVARARPSRRRGGAGDRRASHTSR